jgi:CheY-like chemotaxis protein
VTDKPTPTAAPTAPDAPDEEMRVLLVDDDEDFVTLAATLLEAESDRIETTTETQPQDALASVEFAAIDCVVSDYRMPEMNGIEFLETVRADHPHLPFILFTGKGDEAVAKEAISVDVNDYIVKDGSAEQYAISANRIENLVSQYRTRQQAQHRQALDTLGQAVLQTVLTEPTREGIEQGICDHLVDTDLYGFAWIGERDPQTDAIQPRVWAGDEGVLDDCSFSVDGETTAVEEKALTSGQQQREPVLTAAADDGEGWAAQAVAAGFDAAVGLPITYEGIPYGVLGVYTARERFSDAAATTLTTLAELTGFAIGASERRRGDTSQQVVEIELAVSRTDLPFVELADRLGCSVELVQTTYRRDGTALTLYQLDRPVVDGDEPDELAAMLDVESVEVLDTDGDTQLSVVSAEPWWDDLTGLYGANIAAATADTKNARLTLELPLTAEVRAVVDHLDARHPEIELVGRHERERATQAVEDWEGLLADELTARQREVLETAYHAGYYEWPHEASSEEVADLLGIAQPTFAEHFWAAQQRIADHLFDDSEK